MSQRRLPPKDPPPASAPPEDTAPKKANFNLKDLLQQTPAQRVESQLTVLQALMKQAIESGNFDSALRIFNEGCDLAAKHGRK